MEEKGVLQEIRELLAAGDSSRDVIERGYAPGSVYKAQRQFRRNGGPPAQRRAAATMAPRAVVLREPASMDRVSPDAGVATALASLRDALGEVSTVRSKVAELRATVQGLTARDDNLDRRLAEIRQDLDRAADSCKQRLGQLTQRLDSTAAALANIVEYVLAGEQLTQVGTSTLSAVLTGFTLRQTRERLGKALRSYLAERPSLCSGSRAATKFTCRYEA